MTPKSDSKESHIPRLLQITLRNGGYMMALVEAYFDESGTHDGSSVVCVAGYIFDKAKAVDLDYEWRLMLSDYRLPFFRMADCAHNKGAFAHLSKPECIEAATRAIGLVKKYAAQGIAISIPRNSFPLIPLYGRTHNEYSFAATQVIHGIKKWADAEKYDGDVAMFFESGAQGRGLVDSEFERIFSRESLKVAFRVTSHTFLQKADAAQLQCADMLSWHWYTYQKRAERNIKKKRGDFTSLVEHKNVDVHHYDKESIEKWVGEMKKTGQ